MTDTVHKLHYYAERGIFNLDELHKIADEYEKMRDALRSIAEIEYDYIKPPTTPNEGNLWGILDGCIRLAENALKVDEEGGE